jgi:predicted nucleotidyltransferase
MAVLDAKTLPPDALAALPALCRRFGVERLDIFGSAVTGRFDPMRSDLDFLVTFEPGREREGIRGYFAFADALAQLFGREVDLVEEKALRDPVLIRRIARERVPLFRPA